MKNAELSSKTVAELKALAKKKKIDVPAAAKKTDIIRLIMRATAPAAPKKSPLAQKRPVAAAAKPSAAAPARVSAKTAAPKAKTKPAPGGRPGVAAPAAAPKHDWNLPAGAEEPLMAQAKVTESKYYTGPEERKEPLPYDYLPQEYGEEGIALMARDPYIAYSYWELPQARLEKEKAWFGWDSKLCVRLYDVTGVNFDGANAAGYFDQEVYERVGAWYFDLGRPTHVFCADLGLLAPNGRFLTIVRSNTVTMPRDGVSDVIDEEWMLVDEEFMKLYGMPGGLPGGLSSPEVQEALKRRRMMHISSPGAAPSKQRPKRK